MSYVIRMLLRILGAIDVFKMVNVRHIDERGLWPRLYGVCMWIGCCCHYGIIACWCDIWVMVCVAKETNADGTA